MPVSEGVAIVVASITVVPGTLAALAAWRAVNKGRAEMRTGNGQTVGTMIYKIHESQVRHEADPKAHQKLQPDQDDVV